MHTFSPSPFLGGWGEISFQFMTLKKNSPGIHSGPKLGVRGGLQVANKGGTDSCKKSTFSRNPPYFPIFKGPNNVT